jgi:acetolactate synthase-1/2/3 large subunit
MKTMTGAQALMQALVDAGADIIFGYPGGSIMPAYDALYDYRNKIRHILVRHEQGAAHAAEGYAQVSGKVGVCLVTSGPGATNLLTGIADAMMDSIPLVCITGQVGSAFLGTDAFQEAPIIGMSTPVTKWCHQITEADEIPEAVAQAFRIATTGRPGPILLDITKNALIEMCTPHKRAPTQKLPEAEPINNALIHKAAELLNKAERPLILAGHGVRIAHAEQALRTLVERSGIPVASTLLGLSSLPADNPLNRGLLGMHGNYAPNMLTNKADVILAVGMRFDDRVTGKVSGYAPHATIIHIDIDAAEIHKIMRATVAIRADALHALAALLPHIKKRTHPEWLAKFATLDAIEQKKVHAPLLSPTTGGMTMAEVVHLLSEGTKGSAIVVSDVGQHQMVTARYYRFVRENSFITSGGLGTMGYALPASAGAKLANPKREVLAIMGDGSAQMNIQELGTIMQEKLPIKIIILNNGHLGMVRQWQEMFYDKRYSFVDMQSPNFVTLASAYGINCETVRAREELAGAVDRMLKSKETHLLEVHVRPDENVLPMVPSGKAVDEIMLKNI